MLIRISVCAAILGASASIAAAQPTDGSSETRPRQALYYIDHPVFSKYREVKPGEAPAPADKDRFVRDLETEERGVRRRVGEAPRAAYVGAGIVPSGYGDSPFVQRYTRREVDRSETFGARVRRRFADLAKGYTTSDNAWVRRKAQEIVAASAADETVTETPLARYSGTVRTLFVAPEMGHVESWGRDRPRERRAITPEVAGKIATRVERPLAIVLKVNGKTALPIHVEPHELPHLVQPGPRPTPLETLLRNTQLLVAGATDTVTLSLREGVSEHFGGFELGTIPATIFSDPKRPLTRLTPDQIQAQRLGRAKRLLPVEVKGTPAVDGIRQRLEGLDD